MELENEIVLYPEAEPPSCQQKGATLVFTGTALDSMTDFVEQMRKNSLTIEFPRDPSF